jgi:hypothetical protein
MIFKKSGETEAAAQPRLGDGSGSAGAAKIASPQGAKFSYVDRPDCPETFADSITGLAFDGQTLRIEFAVTRVDEVKANTPLTGRRYPACRLVLPPLAAIDLINKMQQVAAALAQAGVVKAAAKPGETKGS